MKDDRSPYAAYGSLPEQPQPRRRVQGRRVAFMVLGLLMFLGAVLYREFNRTQHSSTDFASLIWIAVALLGLAIAWRSAKNIRGRE